MPKKRRAKKPETKLTCVPLQWPSQGEYPRTPKEKRIIGSYHFKTTDNMLRNGVTALASADKALRKTLKSMGVPWARLTWECASHQEASDVDHHEPGVALYYWFHQKEHVMACDRYLTIVSNLRAATEAVDGMFKLLRAGCVHDFTAAMERFSATVAVRPIQKAPTKIGLDPKYDWAAILEFSKDELDPFEGVPSDHHLIGKRKIELVSRYHPDKPTCPDKGESFGLIVQASEYLKDYIEGIKTMQGSQEAVKKRAKEAADARHEVRMAQEAKLKAELERLPTEDTEAEVATETETVPATPEPEAHAQDVVGHEWAGTNGLKQPSCTYCGTDKSPAAELEECLDRIAFEQESDDPDDSDIDAQDQELEASEQSDEDAEIAARVESASAKAFAESE